MPMRSKITLLCLFVPACLQVDEAPLLSERDAALFQPQARNAWVIAAIEANNIGLSASDRADKYCKMVSSPFAFYRATNHLFWHDLHDDLRFGEFGGVAHTRTWLQGDLHTDNFGVFDDDHGTIVYDLNDFDEVVIADYQWDVWRLATSLRLVAAAKGFSTSQAESFVDAMAESYLDRIAADRGNDGEIDRQFTVSNTYGLLDDFLVEVEAHESRSEMLDDWTVLDDGVRVFDLGNPELAAVDPAIVAQIEAAWPSYVATTAGSLAQTPGYFEIKDIAARLDAGLGSLGVPRYYVLIEGSGGGQSNDRILDLKRQGPPAAAPYLSAEEQALLDDAAANHALRAIEGYRALLSRADDHLGALSLADGVYSLRERSPYKATFDTTTLDSMARFVKLAEQWGAILATAHARADKDYRPELLGHSFDKQVDELTDGLHGEFRALVRELADGYQQQVALDHAAFAAYVGQQLACP